MNRETTLRAFSNVLGQDTIVTFLIVIIFLWLVNYLFKKVRKRIANRWIASFTATWISSMVMLLAYGIILLASGLITKYTFGSDTNFSEMPSYFLFRCIAISLVISFLYLLYFGVKEKWINRLDHPLRRSVFEALAMLIICCTLEVCIQVFGNLGVKGYRLESAFQSLATFAAVAIGTSLAIFTYSYGTYLNTLKIQQKELQIARLRQQVAQSQLDALSSKINPHFLYNSLNAIAGLATEDGLKTRDMAIALSKLFRYNINRSDSSFATVKEEMEMVSLYLEIEKIRFEDRLQYTSTIQPGIENEMVPMHLLQPLVENAVKHGAGPDGIIINVNIKKQDNDMVLSVQDKGCAFDTDFNPGYGLKSLYDKLDILAPGKYEIAFLSEPKEVRIKISDLNYRNYEHPFKNPYH